MSAATVAGIFLIVMPLAFNAAFGLLAARFDYPDILGSPGVIVGERSGNPALGTRRERGGPLAQAWCWPWRARASARRHLLRDTWDARQNCCTEGGNETRWHDQRKRLSQRARASRSPGRPRFLVRDDGTDRQAAGRRRADATSASPIHRAKGLQMTAELLRNHLRSSPEPPKLDAWGGSK